MKNLLALFLLLGAFASGAQTSEKYLLGTWKLSSAIVNNIALDFEARTFTVPQDVEQPTQGSPGWIGQYLNGNHPFPVSVTFKEGAVAEYVVDSRIESYTYTLTYGNGTTLLTNARGVCEVGLVKGVLSFIYEAQGSRTVITFKKQ